MIKKRIAAIVLAAALIVGSIPVSAAETDILTRGEAADLLLSAGFKYTPELEVSDILKGYPGGKMDLDRPVTRIQAMVMLERAFGGLPTPAGDNARMAWTASAFADVPKWAEGALSGVLNAGIVPGTEDGLLDPDQPVSRDELDALIRRVYALKGSDLRDDFYATANKFWLDGSNLPAGLSVNGPFYGLGLTVNQQVAKLIVDIDAQEQPPGTAEAKIKALYDTVLDSEEREAAGVAPIQKYLDGIDRAKTQDELMEVVLDMGEEAGLTPLIGFGITTDLADSTKRIATFGAMGAGMDKDFYITGTEAQKAIYLDYISTVFQLSGQKVADAKAAAETVYDAEKSIATASMDPQDYGDVDKIYNLYTMEELQKMFPSVNLKKFYDLLFHKPTDKILVMDVGAIEAAAILLDGRHLGQMKAMTRYALLQSVCGCLNQAFLDASFDFSEAYYGINARQSTQEIAALQVQSLLPDYLGRAYAQAHFSPEAKADVENMIREFIAIYGERIRSLDWMSDATKRKALQKLAAMQIKVGYPDRWETWLDNADIKGPDQGGTFYSNVIAIQKAALAEAVSRMDKPVDKSEWRMYPFTVNACYDATSNDITFPTAILQPPLYDVNAPREENLGGIGYIIAHEITHAFDNNGSKFDEAGNAATSADRPYGWWTAADYAAFTEKCAAVVSWYDGVEVYPGIVCDGNLTLAENVSDLGSIQCILSAAGKLENTDYDRLFRAVANTWASTSTRQIRELLSTADIHAPDKLRCNRVLQTVDQFYETYDIHPGDGMWTEPDSRVSVW